MKKGFTLVELLVAIAVIGIVAAILVASFAEAGGGESTQDVDQATQEQILSRAQSVEPVYQTQNFLSRRAINKWTERLDTPDKLWYVYLMTESGAFIGYHVCNTVPLSYGVSITNPKQRIEGYGTGDATVVMPAPGSDGVFYAGTSNDVHYCFDAETDALITFNTEFVYYDQPINVEAPELRLSN